MPIIKSSRDPRIQLIVKQSDETVNNSNVLQDDAELKFDVAVGENVLVFLVFDVKSSAVADFKCNWTIPDASGDGSLSMNAQSTGTQYWCWNSAATVWSTFGDDHMALTGMGVLTSAAAGTVQLQWAQNTAEATDTIMYANSFLLVIRP